MTCTTIRTPEGCRKGPPCRSRRRQPHPSPKAWPSACSFALADHPYLSCPAGGERGARLGGRRELAGERDALLLVGGADLGAVDLAGEAAEARKDHPGHDLARLEQPG